ncbi:MAG: AAA family ATPase [Betaproteobacteria bacterium]|uniref:Putative methanol dehydrogenase regulatory protein n=1 Tax=Thiomonas delicata TaxID=364030 RepID=A0A238D9C5_THIDL|nr:MULTISPECIES: MoxR family ATPase [Thiomonas]MDE2128899.1 AAA family ATPase [Betaproteobacteria bacterium]OZB64626.1 MAG: AAA family ATPase [Thiomonas sp. 13-66-29]SBP89907.1 putative methanol dehydrogenase regulatory protein [Thiomonas delicata]
MNPQLAALVAQIDSVLVGKHAQAELAVCCLLAGGHLLIEDLPGVGKTTLAHTLARTFGLEFSRVQFTADLMPGDLLGMTVIERASGQFTFHPGPVFTQVLLADEINRAPPKTQSALLEAMEERQVTIDGNTRALPSPFFVIATQNPHDQRGTYALPESQLDRFLMCLSLGYPDAGAERALLLGEDRRTLLARLPALLDTASLAQLQEQAQAVHVADALVDYVQRLLAATRDTRRFSEGLSPRAGLALLRATRAHALLQGRDYCSPEDVQAVLPAVCVHRLRPTAEAGSTRDAVQAQVAELLRQIGI